MRRLWFRFAGGSRGRRGSHGSPSGRRASGRRHRHGSSGQVIGMPPRRSTLADLANFATGGVTVLIVDEDE